ncbi:DUF1207 domain-containing protein [Candidatus Protochlamydia phocaeensis]|uniref:DUF1207 domain-containing protein n=1 Tax=Candidatus Protochlamydia phocaeensis TaxID=1414722 RepID=UPI0009ABF23F|nr:DUF1207 domain-containing protein [Candidatus Protochlamydia phocaeensis]
MRYARYLWIFLLGLNGTALQADEPDYGYDNVYGELNQGNSSYCCENSCEKINECDPCASETSVVDQQLERDFDLYRQVHPEIYNENEWCEADPETDCEFARSHHLWGIWFPEGPPLFRPLLADPRQATYSVGWRFNDRVIEKNVIDVSFWDTFPIFRWVDVWCWHGDLQLDLEGGVWAIFDPLHDSSPLVDADYYVGFPLTYAFENWAFRLRGYHISTHIGDEFLLNHPHFDRRNPSIEAFDFFVSNQFTREIRLYGGIGWVACQDDSFRVGEIYLQAGLELRLPQLGYRDYCNRLYGEPFFGMNFYYQSHFKRHINNTYVLGYEWGKVSGNRHKFRLFIEYHDGYSLDGQFCKHPTHYFSVRGSYGY